MKYAFRQLAKSPGFSVAALLTLALGIGATTAIFSVVNTVLLRPLDYREPDQIVTLWSYNLKRATPYPVSGPDFRDWREQSRSFAALARYDAGEAGVVVGGAAERLTGSMVSDEFFRVLDVAPRVGRLFSAEEIRTGGAVIVGEAFARRHFAGDITAALGASLKVWGQTFRIVGVLPATCTFPEKSELWLPSDTVFPETTSRSAHNYRAVARLASGVSVRQAQAEMDGIAARLAELYPDSNTNKGARLLPLQDWLVHRHQATLWVMLGAVSLVLLIACANIANLLLARGARRTHEIALRAALGASRGRIVRHLLTESLALALLGGAGGVFIAIWGLDALLALAPAGVPRIDEVVLDGRTLLFACAISLLVCLLTGLFPALQASRVDLTTALHAGGRGIAGGRSRVRSVLVVAQLALSFVLLTSAGLLLRSFQLLTDIEPGYVTESVLVMEANYPAMGEAGAPQAIAFYEEFRRRSVSLPGVGAVSYTRSLPVDDLGSHGTYRIEGRAAAAPGDTTKHSALWRVVGPDYFSTLGIPLRAGREIDARDTAAAPHTIVINESMARAGWPGESPLGHRIWIGWDSQGEWMTIVGIVADTRQGSLERPIGQELFVPASQHPRIATDMKVIARAAPRPKGQRSADPLTLAGPFRRVVQELNPEVPVKFTTAELLVTHTLATPRFRTLLIGLFAGVAVALAAIGLYSVLAYGVAQRTAEIGIRMALGAQRHQVLALFLHGGVRLSVIGLALGLAGAAAAARLVQSFLFNMQPLDPLVYAAVVLLFSAIVILACLLPARRATQVDPVTALRAE